MKKLLYAMLSFALCIGMTSCKEEANKGNNETELNGNEVVKDINENESEEIMDIPDNESLSIEDIVAKAKAEGDRWNVGVWKAQFRNMLKGIKPMIDDMLDLQKKSKTAKGDDSKIEELSDELMDTMNKYEKEYSLMLEFCTTAENSANGTKVINDQDFEKEMINDFGLADINGVLMEILSVINNYD